jgi:hypothetical protein
MITNYYEVRYELYDNTNTSIGKFSMPVAAKDKKAAYLKCGEKIGPHSILYAVEISYSLYHSWGK